MYLAILKQECYDMIKVSKGQNAVHACDAKASPSGPEKAFGGLRELFCIGAIRLIRKRELAFNASSIEFFIRVS